MSTDTCVSLLPSSVRQGVAPVSEDFRNADLADFMVARKIGWHRPEKLVPVDSSYVDSTVVVLIAFVVGSH
jgi:hypothetical protein